jgi:hypothetical protein
MDDTILLHDNNNTNPFANRGLSFIESRLEELADNLPSEMDLDTDELLFLQQAILLCETEMTADRAFKLQKNLDRIERFVEDQKEKLQVMLQGVSKSRSAKGQYGQQKSKVRSRFVYQKV